MARSSKLSSKKHAFAAALFGLVTTASGIISTVLFYYFLANFDDNSIIHTPPQLNFWWTPVPFIVPGILGIAAAVVRKKLLFAFYLAVAIMTLLVTGVFLVIVLVFVVDLPSEYSPAHCKVQQGQCYCQRELKDTFEQATGYADCDAMFQMLVYGHVGTGIYVLGWGLCFAGALLSCITCNYIERRRARDIVAYSTRHSPSIKVSTVQPPDRRQAGAINVAYVYS